MRNVAHLDNQHSNFPQLPALTATVAVDRMDTSLGFGFGNALDTVDAAFKFHVAVDVAAGHHEDDFFETTKPRRTGIHEFHAPPLGFGIAGVHAEKVPSKKGRFIAAGTGADFHDDVLFIIGVF
mgnify:CR=1 FL=1